MLPHSNLIRKTDKGQMQMGIDGLRRSIYAHTISRPSDTFRNMGTSPRLCDQKKADYYVFQSKFCQQFTCDKECTAQTESIAVE